MKLSVYYSVNMGVCLSAAGHRVWVDFCPGTKTPSFSCMSAEDWARVSTDPALSPTEILFTHCHPDHYSRAWTGQCPVLFPGVPVMVPAGSAFSGRRMMEFSADDLPVTHVSGREFLYEAGPLCIRMIRTVHSSRMFAEVPHYSIFLTVEGKTILISGDARIPEDELLSCAEQEHIDLAILNFPWASVLRGRELTEQVVRPEHLLLVHIPNAEDNVDHYRETAESSAQLLQLPDVRLALEPYTEFTYDLS